MCLKKILIKIFQEQQLQEFPREKKIIKKQNQQQIP